MPMKKSSTLIYLINRFQEESDSSLIDDEYADEIFEKAERAEMAPSKQTINNILGFAKSYEVVETKTSGAVEMILN